VTNLRIVLTAVEDSLGDGWERFCGDLPFVSVHRGTILNVDSDAVVSPANSFGFMDGGIDALQRGRFSHGRHAGQRIADHIRTVAMPGLGTGVGRIGFNTCARHVRAAIDDVLLAKYQMPQSWAEAGERHQLLYIDRPTRLQY
jgi:O-acetyl-ADP-ribose deacetylase (regulator of RNase III)